MKFSIVIATRNRAERLDAALTSLGLQGDAPPLEIIVVDNGSTDATPAVVRKHGARYLHEPVPNRARARNRGVAAATGSYVLFVDDDVVVPAGFVGMHARVHDGSIFPRVVTGPILNVASPGDRPSPSSANYSGAYFCTCNGSVRKSALEAVGGFDERFDLYGWEDTDVGLRLRNYDVAHVFAWDAYLWHIKPPVAEPLAKTLTRTLEKASMAARFVAKSPGPRARLATGAYAANLWRANVFAPAAAQPLLAGIATSPKVRPAFARLARGWLLDSVYAAQLTRELRRDR